MPPARISNRSDPSCDPIGFDWCIAASRTRQLKCLQLRFGTAETDAREIIKPTPRAPSYGRIEIFPLSRKPLCRLKPTQDRIERAREHLCSIEDVSACERLRVLLQKHGEDPQRCRCDFWLFGSRRHLDLGVQLYLQLYIGVSRADCLGSARRGLKPKCAWR